MKLVISLKRWFRGHTSKYSRLYRASDRQMCCLGFLARECGAKVKDICGVTTPASCPDLNWPEGTLTFYLGVSLNSDIIGDLMKVNDDPDLSDKERKRLIKEGMAKLGVEVKFVP